MNPTHKRFTTIGALLTVLILVSVFSMGCGKGNGANPSGALEATEVNVASTASGKVLEVRYREGAVVKSGDTLVVLDTELLKLQLAQAVAASEGLESQSAAARNALEQAKENSQLAEVTLGRIEALNKQGSSTRQQLDEARTRRDVAKSQKSSAENQIAALKSEKNRLAAQIGFLRRQITDGTIIAPMDGTVLLRSVEPGEVLTAGSTAMRLADLSHLELKVYLDVEDVDRVQLGKEVTVLVDSFEKEPLTGRVSWISSEAEFTPKNVQTRNARAQLVYAIKVELQNGDGRLAIGMPAEIILP